MGGFKRVEVLSIVAGRILEKSRTEKLRKSHGQKHLTEKCGEQTGRIETDCSGGWGREEGEINPSEPFTVIGFVLTKLHALFGLQYK